MAYTKDWHVLGALQITINERRIWETVNIHLSDSKLEVDPVHQHHQRHLSFGASTFWGKVPLRVDSKCTRQGLFLKSYSQLRGKRQVNQQMLTVPTKQQKNQQGEFSIKTQRKEAFGEGEMTTSQKSWTRSWRTVQIRTESSRRQGTVSRSQFCWCRRFRKGNNLGLLVKGLHW